MPLFMFSGFYFLVNVNDDLRESVMFNFKNENVFVLRSYVRLLLPVLMFNYKNGKCIYSSK